MIQQIKYKQQILEFSSLNLITGTMASDSYSLFQNLIDQLAKKDCVHVAYNRTQLDHPYEYKEPNFKMWFLKICGIEFTEMKAPFKGRISEVIKVILNTKPEDVLFLEYPEMYLHPSSQSKLTDLICETVNRSVQVFCLTHSDHIINRCRVAAKKQKIDFQKTSIHFFNESECIPLTMSQKGRLDKWPRDFFDEWGNALDLLL